MVVTVWMNAEQHQKVGNFVSEGTREHTKYYGLTIAYWIGSQLVQYENSN